MRPWPIWLAGLLLALSALVYLLNYLLFGDLYHIQTFFLSDLAFAFIEVLLVVLVVEELLERRARTERLSKMFSLIGVFFSEVGMALLRIPMTSAIGTNIQDPQLVATPQWKEEDFRQAIARCETLDLRLSPSPEILTEIRELLHSKRDFLIRMMENPMLLEHEHFTDLILAMMHLDEELEFRSDLTRSPPSDLEHLSNDTTRAYRLLMVEWLAHLRYLSNNYPYLYSLAIRMNPLRPDAGPVVWT